MTKSRLNILAKSSAGASRFGSLADARLFLKKQIWIWPLLAAVVLFACGTMLRRAVERSLEQSLESQLQVVLNADVAALNEWFLAQERNVAAAARDRDVVAAVEKLGQFIQHDVSPLAIAKSAELETLEESLKPWLEVGGYDDFVLIDRDKRIIGTAREELLGKEARGRYEEFATRTLAGQVSVTRPFPSVVMLPDRKGELRSGLPTMFACSPVIVDGKTAAALCFRLKPDEGFSDVLQLARLGKSGETYVFDKSGLLLSESRFEQELKDIGLIPNTEDASSVMTVQLCDPGVNLVRGERAKVPRSQLPLILPVVQAAAGKSGVSVGGHRDYRGVPQASAWTWLDKYDMGVITDMDYDEAMAPRQILDAAFWGMFALLALLSLAMLVASFLFARMRARMQREVLKQQKLGQYHLLEKLGEGGMGVVYRGQHAMLRRPTAIKLLNIQKTNEASIARFEREVQSTSQLNHPNTIAIYDYGRTPEGIFYYAMEYLDGIDLERLVTQYGPLPESRVIHLLLQVCGSLAEAHALGLIHRDIKPANLIVGNRGGVADFVKVLDFGLVKALDAERMKTLTAAEAITGTPMYIPPEGIEKPSEVDARSDIYSLGAVGYYLLTGQQPYDAANVVELCMKVVAGDLIAPSARIQKSFDADLEAVILKAMAKDKLQRYSSVDEFAKTLRHCAAFGKWSLDDARTWWQSHPAGQSSASSMPTPTGDIDTQTLVWSAAAPEASAQRP